MAFSDNYGSDSRAENTLGKVAGLAGLISLALNFVPVLGAANVLVAPFAFIAGLVAVRRKPRAMAIVGIASGLVAIVIFISIMVVRN